MDYQQVLTQVEAACDDFNVAATRVAAEQVLRAFREQPNVHPAALHVLLNSASPQAKHHAAVAIATSICRSRQCPTDELEVLSQLLTLLCHHDSSSYWVKSVATAAAAIVKRKYNDQQDLAMSVIQQLSTQQATTSASPAALMVARALIDVMCDGSFSPPIPSFHMAVKQHFQNHTLEHVLIFALQQLEASAATLNPTEAWTQRLFGLSLEVTEKCLSWPFLGESDVPSDIAATLLPAAWADHIMTPHFVRFLFSLATHLPKLQYDTTLHVHRVFQCISVLCCSPSLAKKLTTTDLSASGEIMFCTAIVHGLQMLLEALSSSFSGPLLNGVCAILRRLHHHFALDSVLSHVSGFDTFLLSVAQATTNTLAVSSRSEEERTWLEEASGELMGMWSRLLSEATRLQRSNMTLRPEFLFTLGQMAASISEAYLQSKMSRQGWAESDDDEEDFIGLKDWEVYEEELLDYSVIARFNPTLHADVLASLLCQAHSHITSATELSVAHLDATHWLLLCVGAFLADSLDSELNLVPDSFLMEPAATHVLAICNQLLSLASAIVQHSNVISPMVAESCWWALCRFSGCYTCIVNEEYDPIFHSSQLAVAFQSETWENLVKLALLTLTQWYGEQAVIEQIGSFVVASSRQKQICSVLASQVSLFSQLVSFVLNSLERGSFPDIAAPLYVKGIVRICVNGARLDLAMQVITFIGNMFNQVASLPPRDFMLEETTQRLSRCLEMAGGAALGFGLEHIGQLITPLLNIINNLPHMMVATKKCPSLWLPVFEAFASFVQSGIMEFVEEDQLLTFASCFDVLVHDFASSCTSNTVSQIASAVIGGEQQSTMLQVLDVISALVEMRGCPGVLCHAISALALMLPTLCACNAFQVPSIAIQATQACKSLTIQHQHAFHSLASFPQHGSLPLSPWHTVLSIIEPVLATSAIHPAMSNALETLGHIHASNIEHDHLLTIAQMLVLMPLSHKIALDHVDLLGQAVWAVVKPLQSYARFEEALAQSVSKLSSSSQLHAQELIQQLFHMISDATLDDFQPQFQSWLIEAKALH